VFLYGCTSLRVDGKPLSRQKCLAKIDTSNKEIITNENYATWLLENNFTDNEVSTYLASKNYTDYSIKNKYIDINLNSDPVIIKINDSKKNSRNIIIVNNLNEIVIKNFGAIYLLNNIVETIGLKTILSKIFPNNYHEILALALFYVIENTTALYCKYWLKNTDLPIEPTKLSSQRISELFKKINDEDIINFYTEWCKYRKEKEFLATDITSISTYGNSNSYAEYGYNRDHDKLKQINLCLLFGESSALPVFSTIYNGSLNDVSTFKNTVETFEHISDNNHKLVMDKGFYSETNINYMFNYNPEIRFLLGCSANNDFYKNIIDKNIDLESDHKHTLNSGSDILFYRALKEKWINNNRYLNAFLYFNPVKKCIDKSKILYKINEMFIEATKKPEKYSNKSEYKKIFIFRKSFKSPNGYIIKLRDTVLDSIHNKGYLLLLSNEIKDPKEAIKVYRNKNIVEEAFNKIKNFLDSKRLYVQSNEAMHSKLFTEFIALIITSQVHNVMEDRKMYKKYTMKELFEELDTIKIINIRGNNMLYPLTAEQKEILHDFKCPFPNINKLNI
jgi:transposase